MDQRQGDLLFLDVIALPLPGKAVAGIIQEVILYLEGNADILTELLSSGRLSPHHR